MLSNKHNNSSECDWPILCFLVSVVHSLILAWLKIVLRGRTHADGFIVSVGFMCSCTLQIICKLRPVVNCCLLYIFNSSIWDVFFPLTCIFQCIFAILLQPAIYVGWVDRVFFVWKESHFWYNVYKVKASKMEKASFHNSSHPPPPLPTLFLKAALNLSLSQLLQQLLYRMLLCPCCYLSWD